MQIECTIPLKTVLFHMEQCAFGRQYLHESMSRTVAEQNQGKKRKKHNENMYQNK